MAVTKIRKVSSTTLLVLLALSVLIFVLFFAGGSELDAKGNKDYAFTGILLYWTYFLFIVTVLATLFFAGRSIATNKTKDVVARKSNLISVVVLVVSLILDLLLMPGVFLFRAIMLFVLFVTDYNRYFPRNLLDTPPQTTAPRVTTKRT